MSGIENIQVSLYGSFLLYLLFAFLLGGFSIFIYRFTLPKVSGVIKTILTLLRALIFLLILFLIFEPLLSISSRYFNEKSTVVFIDNSKSISAKDSANNSRAVLNLLSELSSSKELKIKLFSFGKKIDTIATSNYRINFDLQQTNYSVIADYLKSNEKDINSAVIISDGIITDGYDPYYLFEKLQFPIFTVGVGDSSIKRDIEIFNVSHNQFIYVGNSTQIKAVVKHNGFDDKPVKASLFEENTLVESKDIILGNSGINQIYFTYTPQISGEKKLSVSISNLPGEFTNLNNQKMFFISVLDTKLKISILAGAPSADVAAISNALERNSNFSVNKLIQVSSNNIWKENGVKSLDSSRILFLVDFPAANTPQQLMNQVISKIETGTPFFISVSSSTNFEKLKQFEKHLPFYAQRISQDFVQVQADLQKSDFINNFSQIGIEASIWNNLPPVDQSASEVIAKPESKVIVKSKIKETSLNNPLVLLRSIGSQRAFGINAANIWRWSLQNSEKNPEFFNLLLNEIVKWLSIAESKSNFTLTTNKKVFSPSEQVELFAELYDNAFNPIDTAKISLLIENNFDKFKIIMTPQGKGIYNAQFTPTQQGDFLVSAKTEGNSASPSVRFSITSSSLELIDTRKRTEYLKYLASSTNGSYFSVDEVNNILQSLLSVSKKIDTGRMVKNEYEIWNYSWVLVTIILLFASEWFIRKRFGMI